MPDPDEGNLGAPLDTGPRTREIVTYRRKLPPAARVTQIDIEHILLIEDIRQLLEQSEQVGSVRASDLAEIAETTS